MNFPIFKKTVLYTQSNGFAAFSDEPIALTQGNEKTALSVLFSTAGLQLRMSPVGFSSDFHVTTTPQWVFILSGQMLIGLRDGTYRIFKAGEHFFSNDTLPYATAFDANVHGHRSAQVGEEPLITAFVRV
jgi:hypothetical protein